MAILPRERVIGAVLVRRFVELSLCSLLLLFGSAEAAKAKMPPGSFLTKPVAGPSELADLVKQSKVVAQRYSKHFGMDPSSLAQYFHENVKISTLSKTGKYTVYFIAKDGKILQHKKRLKAGTKIFVAWNGHLILEGKCGNPVTKTLPKPPVKVTVAPTVQELPTTPPPPPTAVVEPVQVAAEAPPPVPQPQVEVLAEPPIELPSMLIPGLLAAGALGFAGGGRNEQPVPEPAGLLVLGLGGASLLIHCYKQRRR